MPTAAIDDYRNTAKEKFAGVTKNIPNYGFWKLGNSLDTMIDYLANVDNSNADGVGKQVIAEGNKLIKAMGPMWPGTWFDDYGWWVISTNRAAQQQFFSADVRNQFAALSTECWNRFTQNAPYTWERRKPGTFNDYGPAVPGGVWNEYWEGTSDQYPGDKDGDPAAGSLHGIQNTVTNAVYMISAQRRKDAAAQREFQFLSNWLFSQKQPCLWWPQADGSALIRERVSRFAKDKPAGGFHADWAWTGDVGLMLGIFLDRLRMGLDPVKSLQVAKDLLRGARWHMIDDKGALQPWAGPDAHVPDGDEGDYRTGTGVFWRYMLQAWKLNNPDLRKFLWSSDFTSFVTTNAYDAQNDPTPDPDELSNQLAVLVLAIVLLKAE